MKLLIVCVSIVFVSLASYADFACMLESKTFSRVQKDHYTAQITLDKLVRGTTPAQAKSELQQDCLFYADSHTEDRYGAPQVLFPNVYLLSESPAAPYPDSDARRELTNLKFCKDFVEKNSVCERL